ncbi:MAG: formylglycine-generating enzyme family protein [Chloroflexi bacterium HGW-Chloroflexi-4]|jgi:iron(II)-dependent oxidoreductase|nr:MAG: formylglycine-generating enzyme family protein [Chloroflexi bacterium HGW-Chloroflexi-4]
MANEKDKKDDLHKRDQINESMKHPLMVEIPAGEFLMGTSDQQIAVLLETEKWAEEWVEEGMFQVEQPQHKVELQSFEIGLYPVSNIDYYSFIYNTGHRVPKNWIGYHYADGEANFPVAGISKKDALAYCEWISKNLKTIYRLPNEAEWEKAARGTDGRIYPWGDFFDPWRCNTLESAKRATTANGSYSPSGDSIYGIADMVGNVWEWTSSFLLPYPFKNISEKEANTNKCVVRGGAWYYSHKLARCAARETVLADYVSPALGFRLARSI